jgi:signal transduction histidine kinase
MSHAPVRVLLVEDDAVDRLACRRALGTESDYVFEVEEADSAREGLTRVHARTPDLILLDYHLPDMDGVEFLAELAAESVEITVPVVMLTGAQDIAIAVDVMRRGARDYLIKDGDGHYLQLLPTVIKRVLQEERLRREKRQAEFRYRSLARHQVGVREEERSRIARDVHDELGQKLTALQLEVSMLSARYHDDPPELSRKLHALLALIDATMDSVRTIAADLRPPVLDLGLVPAIEWQVQEFRRRTGIACELAVGDDDIELDEERATAVFRMLQEALTNVARHARATQVEIALALQQDMLQLTVEDNGVGMPANRPRGRKSFGLLGLRERALMVGGEVNIDSHPGRTVVRITLPVANATLEEWQA